MTYLCRRSHMRGENHAERCCKIGDDEAWIVVVYTVILLRVIRRASGRRQARHKGTVCTATETEQRFRGRFYGVKQPNIVRFYAQTYSGYDQPLAKRIQSMPYFSQVYWRILPYLAFNRSREWSLLRLTLILEMSPSFHFGDMLQSRKTNFRASLLLRPC